MRVSLKPISKNCLKYSLKLRPGPPPPFRNCEGGATEEDRRIARDLFQALDEDSKEWYRFNCKRLFGDL